MTGKLVLVGAMAVLLMIEFAPGCHGKTVNKVNEDDARAMAERLWRIDFLANEKQKVEEEKVEEEDRNAEENRESDELWELAERVADLVNVRRAGGCRAEQGAFNVCLKESKTTADKVTYCTPLANALDHCRRSP